ncbi:MAG: tetratricopeptide repeat protein [Clostridiales bacterium]|nr:tetratricopeptide repeat protein [Clostridiales bacterium]
MKDPYSVLGLTPDASEEELKEEYEALKAEYGEQRFKSGEEGNEGAKKLSELEAAWSQISADLQKKEAKEKFGDGDYGEIDDLIKKGSYDEAQARLDAITDRNAQWHYLQSIVYYKREWLSDSRAQLATAVEMDPTNEKYKTALEKLDMVIGNPNADARTLGADPNMPPPDMQNGQLCGGNALSNCCLAYCVTDCCCQMTRCCG